MNGLKPGERVAAIGSSCFATFVTTKASLVAPLPPTLDSVDAATVPMVFSPRDRAGGARAAPAGRASAHSRWRGWRGARRVADRPPNGAEVYATAGTPEKRDYLRSLGVCHVADSRRTDFANEIWSATGGRGVDVVLNSLAGDFIPRSLHILAPGGRFVEIGKAGIWDEVRVGARRPVGQVLGALLERRNQNHPQRIGERALLDLLDRCASGELQPLPRRAFPLGSAPAAFRFMAQARHIGKVGLVPEQAAGSLEVASNAAYLVTGGLGALGLHAARWLVDHGARHLVLVGRSVPEELSAVDKLREERPSISNGCDVTAADDVQRLIRSFGRCDPSCAV